MAPRGCAVHVALPQSTGARRAAVLQRQRGALPCIGASAPLLMHKEALQANSPRSRTAAPAAGCPQPRSPSSGRPPSPRSQTRSATGEQDGLFEGEPTKPCTLELAGGPAPQPRCVRYTRRRLAATGSRRTEHPQPRCVRYTRRRLAATGSRRTEHPGHHASCVVARRGPTSGSMPNSLTSLRLVDTATMCLATASWPSSAVSQVLR